MSGLSVSQCVSTVAECPSITQVPISQNTCVEAGEGKNTSIADSTWELNPKDEVTLSPVGIQIIATIEGCILAGENDPNGNVTAVSFDSGSSVCSFMTLDDSIPSGSTGTPTRSSPGRCTYVRRSSTGIIKPNEGIVSPVVNVLVDGKYYHYDNVGIVEAKSEVLGLQDRGGVPCREFLSTQTLNPSTDGPGINMMEKWCNEAENEHKQVCTDFCIKNVGTLELCSQRSLTPFIISCAVAGLFIIGFALALYFVPSPWKVKIVTPIGVVLVLGSLAWVWYEGWNYYVNKKPIDGSEPDAEPLPNDGSLILTSHCGPYTTCSGIVDCNQINPGSTTCVWCLPDISKKSGSNGYFVSNASDCKGYAASIPGMCTLDKVRAGYLWDVRANKEVTTGWNELSTGSPSGSVNFFTVVNKSPIKWELSWTGQMKSHFSSTEGILVNVDQPLALEPFTYLIMVMDDGNSSKLTISDPNETDAKLEGEWDFKGPGSITITQPHQSQSPWPVPITLTETRQLLNPDWVFLFEIEVVPPAT